MFSFDGYRYQYLHLFTFFVFFFVRPTLKNMLEAQPQQHIKLCVHLRAANNQCNCMARFNRPLGARINRGEVCKLVCVDLLVLLNF